MGNSGCKSLLIGNLSFIVLSLNNLIDVTDLNKEIFLLLELNFLELDFNNNLGSIFNFGYGFRILTVHVVFRLRLKTTSALV